jgi:hypothetical protein
MQKIIHRIKHLALRVSLYPDVLCLLGLGSMAETNRLDDYSDMDFFLIVKDDTKEAFIRDLSWLEVVPLTFQFQNTKDGYKVLFEDGIFAEFAVFTETEMLTAHFTKGRIYYQKEGFDLSIVEPRYAPKRKTVDPEFNVCESLTNIYIGLKRHCRGEISSATTFIQSYAYPLIIELMQFVYPEHSILEDPYVYERRIETRFPDANFLLNSMRQGALKNQASAKAMLDFLKEYFHPNPHLVAQCESML